MSDNWLAEILEQARRLKADYIVTGSRGLGGLQSVLMGSVSTYIVKHRYCIFQGVDTCVLLMSLPWRHR